MISFIFKGSTGDTDPAKDETELLFLVMMMDLISIQDHYFTDCIVNKSEHLQERKPGCRVHPCSTKRAEICASRWDCTLNLRLISTTS
jgi:hypothetical protein